MIGSNLYVGDFGDYRDDELFKFHRNFNLQLRFFRASEISEFEISPRLVSGPNPWCPGPTYAMLASFLIAISLDRGWY